MLIFDFFVLSTFMNWDDIFKKKPFLTTCLSSKWQFGRWRNNDPFIDSDSLLLRQQKQGQQWCQFPTYHVPWDNTQTKGSDDNTSGGTPGCWGVNFMLQWMSFIAWNTTVMRRGVRQNLGCNWNCLVTASLKIERLVGKK